MPDDKYVLRHEFENRSGKIHERINEVDNKHSSNYNNLLRMIERQTTVQENSLKSQERSEQFLERMSENLTNMSGRIVDLEYRTHDAEEDISSIKKQMDEKQKGNTQIVLGWIGVVGIGLSSIVSFIAQWLFR